VTTLEAFASAARSSARNSPQATGAFSSKN
jgi:hypothetical protein